jgi:hypothetical protein
VTWLIAAFGADEAGAAFEFGTVPTLPSLATVALNGKSQTINTTMTNFSVIDTRGTKSGWNVTVAGQAGTGKSAVFAQYCPKAKCGANAEGYVSGGQKMAANSLTLNSRYRDGRQDRLRSDGRRWRNDLDDHRVYRDEPGPGRADDTEGAAQRRGLSREYPLDAEHRTLSGMCDVLWTLQMMSAVPSHRMRRVIAATARLSVLDLSQPDQQRAVSRPTGACRRADPTAI